VNHQNKKVFLIIYFLVVSSAN